jgi:hypothetical protein
VPSIALWAGKATSIRAAATLFGLKRATLANRVNGRVTRTQARQSQRLLSEAQEGDLLKWIFEIEAIGHAISHVQIREMAGLFIAHAGGLLLLEPNGYNALYNAILLSMSKSEGQLIISESKLLL